MAKRGKVCTLIMMVMKAMYNRTLMKPRGKEGCREQPVTGPGRHSWGCWSRSGEAQALLTCKQLRIEHVHGLIVPRVLALEVHGVQHILDEDGEHHGHQDGILEVGGKGRHKYAALSCSSHSLLPLGLCRARCNGTCPGLDTAGGVIQLFHSLGGVNGNSLALSEPQFACLK